MITWFPQQQRASCVAACVRMVLTGFGQQLPEAQVRQILQVSPLGVTLPKAQRRLLQYKVRAELHEDWSWLDLRDCLRAGWHPIVGVERRFWGHPDASHAVVVIGASNQTIRVFDPLGTAQAEVFNSTTFEQSWRSAGQQALVIQSPLP